MAYTGLRFCNAGALRWEDWDEEAGVLCVVRKHFRGTIGPVSRKKRAPKEYLSLLRFRDTSHPSPVMM